MRPALLRGGLRVVVTKDAGALGEQAADVIFRELKNNPRLLLCASAGGTPTMTYGRLAEKMASAPRAFGRMRVLQIDEWAGLPP
ncbi:MAG: hypothetical protein ACREIC_19210, partial [Limisphaerales bacterium]